MKFFVFFQVLLVGIIITATVATGDERRDVQTRGETRRLNGAYIRRRRPAAATADDAHTPPYAVHMEPLVKYSQRDPLYDKSARSNHSAQEFTSRGDHESEGTNNLPEITAGPRLDYGYPHHQQQYYQEPEPIIEIIIKESNESLPAPTTLPPPPSTKEPVHVFYVKYRKNPHATGKYGESDVIYEPPVPALTQHESDTVEPDPEAQHTPVHVTETPNYLPAQTTTLRTIIRPDSEIYHGSGLKVTFGSPDHHLDRSEHELDESASEVDARLPERQQREHAQNRDSSDVLSTQKPHYFKRQQGPYFPPPPQHNLQDLTPPPPSQQYQLPGQGRQALPNQSTQVIYNRGNQKPNHPPSQSSPPFRPQQQAAATFQRNQHFNPNQSPQLQINFPPNQQPLVGPQSQRYSEPVRQPTQKPNNFRQRPPSQNKFEGGEPQRRPQFQPTLEAQIEEYQKHKLFLHQQNLRHQAQQAEQANQAQLLDAQNQQLNTRNPQHGVQHQGGVQYQPLQPIHVQSSPSQPFQREQLGFQSPKKNINNLPNRHSFSSHQPRDPINLDLHSRGKVPSQNFVTSQPNNHAAPFNPSAPHPTVEKTPFVPSPQHIPPQNQPVYTQPTQHALNPNAGAEYLNRNNDFIRLPTPIYNNAEFVKTISPIEDIDIKSDGESGNKVQSETDSRESHTSEKPGQVIDQPDQNAYNNHKVTPPSSQNHRYEPVYSSTSTPKPRPTFTSRTSGTTSAPPTEQTKVFSLIPSSSPAPSMPEESKEQKPDESDEESPEQQEKKKANLAALPDEIPDDLREQLLSSGILGNADIQILDYDKVGDIPIESLPPEALENLYGAGSAPVVSVVKPDSIPIKKSVEMKVVRYDPNTKEGQGLAGTYLRSDATQLDPVVLNDNRYNRYLPLKISGSNFPLPDVPQLKNRVVNSVVVLAPVDYDFIKTQDDVDRSGRTIQVEGVRFIAGDSLKTLVKEPSLTNYNKWLDTEKETPTGKQSVVLLVTR